MIPPGVKTTADYIASGFAKIDADLNYLMKCLKEVLVDLGETKAAQFLPFDTPTRQAQDRSGLLDVFSRTMNRVGTLRFSQGLQGMVESSTSNTDNVSRNRAFAFEAVFQCSPSV